MLNYNSTLTERQLVIENTTQESTSNEDRANTKKQNMCGYLEFRQRDTGKKFIVMFRP